MEISDKPSSELELTMGKSDLSPYQKWQHANKIIIYSRSFLPVRNLEKITNVIKASIIKASRGFALETTLSVKELKKSSIDVKLNLEDQIDKLPVKGKSRAVKVGRGWLLSHHFGMKGSYLAVSTVVDELRKVVVKADERHQPLKYRLRLLLKPFQKEEGVIIKF